MVKQSVHDSRGVIDGVLDMAEETFVRFRGVVLREMKEQGGEGGEPIDITRTATEIRQEMGVHDKTIELQTSRHQQWRWTIEIEQFKVPDQRKDILVRSTTDRHRFYRIR